MSYMTALSAVMKGAKIFSIPQFDIDSDLENEGLDLWDLDYQTIESEWEDQESDLEDQKSPEAPPNMLPVTYLVTNTSHTRLLIRNLNRISRNSNQNSQVILILEIRLMSGIKCQQLLLTYYNLTIYTDRELKLKLVEELGRIV
ncbi:hypothetical protein OXYTRIMIC_596 [Oxytricha trifallax]|uniref:Uncharacterized protein n=1 Tax=Oxytricha trifallax TaxID=1172189 RepID=A0A073HXM8_9SPIT|nr:hypothetical protein OXYTRIMIC_596 [Oxytricha trifallax]